MKVHSMAPDEQRHVAITRVRPRSLTQKIIQKRCMNAFKKTIDLVNTFSDVIPPQICDCLGIGF